MFVADIELKADPRVYRALRPHIYDINYDSPAAIREWVAQCSRPEANSIIAEHILSTIYSLSDSAWPAMLECLAEGNRAARRALILSLCGMACLKNRIPDQWVRPLIESLRRLDPTEFEDLLVLPNTVASGLGRQLPPTTPGSDSNGEKTTPPPTIPHSAEVVSAAAIVVAEHGPAVDLAEEADRELRKEVIAFADILNYDNNVLISWMASVGGNAFTWVDGSDDEAQQAADTIKNRPEALRVLVHWLIHTLSVGEWESRWLPKAEALLRVTAAVTMEMPAAFAKMAVDTRLEPLLIRAVERQADRYGRRAAVVLLSHLRRVTPGVVKAFLFALRDDRFVQEAAIQSTERFQEVRPDALSLLLTSLYDDSA